MGRNVYKTNLVTTYFNDDYWKYEEDKERFFRFCRELRHFLEVEYFALITLFEDNDVHNGYLIIDIKDTNIFEKVANRTNVTMKNINKIEFLKNYVGANGIGIQEPCGKSILKNSYLEE